MLKSLSQPATYKTQEFKAQATARKSHTDEISKSDTLSAKHRGVNAVKNDFSKLQLKQSSQGNTISLFLFQNFTFNTV